MKELKPASKGTQEAYSPQGSGMEHDSVFAELAPGVAHSGNLKFKYAVPGNHSNTSEPPSNMRGE